jgi:hypothetical protein
VAQEFTGADRLRRHGPDDIVTLTVHQGSGVVVEVGHVPVGLNTTDNALLRLLERRFDRFLTANVRPAFHFDITVVPQGSFDPDAELRVGAAGGRWTLQRGDFHAEWDAANRRGWIRQTLNPYAIDSVLRIVHTIVLATDGGFLLHASSAVRDGRAFLFTGPSGSGKTTIARLAPPDVTLLTDEISYVRRTGDGYTAFGTPFSGELGEGGERVSAPIAALFRLNRGPDNLHERLTETEAIRTLMRNILFFADDRALTCHLLDTACDFAASVPAFRLAFAPDARVWNTIT